MPYHERKGRADEEVALFCLRSVLAAVSGMTQALLRVYGNLPVVYAGGVMSQQSASAGIGGRL